ncbi:hypothetical protein B0A49_06636 [Cryomyces minteri]|uniref:Major facilitator superfamily (MFS) profile domain-containing protein n=1 Tax=Cryomyces minteri TaxID=331657 RepID=A0A4U0WTI2_9PEZI|nr:hypothetical protein B0A49_06636 [Cryomyces minteri]
MTDLLRDTFFGHCVRLATGNKYFQYYEESHPEEWERYVDREKSANLAHHGSVEPEKRQQRNNSNGGEAEYRNSASSSQTQVADYDASDKQASNEKADPEKGRDITLISWNGPDDPENPQNWSRPKKYFVTFELCLLTLSIYIGSAIYTAGIQGVMMQFGVSQVAATLGLTLFVAGYGLGPMLWSPMSEVPQVGRTPIYILTLAVFVIFQVPTALAKNFGMLLAFRFLTGFFGSPVLATGGASIGDMYRPKKRVYAMAVWGVAAVCGPTLGPLVGGFAAESEGWTWTIWELMWLSGFCLVFLIFLLPETSSNNILYRRTRRLRKLTGNESLKCEPELMGEQMSGNDIVNMILVKPFTLNFTEPMVFLLNLYIALVYGLLYIWFESFPIVFIGIYNFTLGELGLAFLGILIGALATIPFYFLWIYFVHEKQFDDAGNVKPEKRLQPACVGAFFIPICLFWFGWSSRPSIHWIMPIIGSGFFSVGTLLLFNAVLNYLADVYVDNVASVLAGNDLMRSAFGAGFPLFAGAMFRNLGVGWASSLLGFLSIVFIPIPFALYFYGETLRKKHSKIARKDI